MHNFLSNIFASLDGASSRLSDSRNRDCKRDMIRSFDYPPSFPFSRAYVQ